MRWLTGSLICLMFATPGFAKQLWTERSKSAPSVQIPSLAPLVKEASSAVLTIEVEGKVENASAPFEDPRMDLFRQFGFEFRLPQMQPQKGQGTGFLISNDGYALTNNHVVENAGVIRVRVGGERKQFEADVIGSDPNTDVALIRLRGDRKKWPVVPLGDSDSLEVGDLVVAIGNPFGLSQSVSMGIISARGRKDVAPSGRQGLYNFLQTDASINPGNSGGPLVNLNGEVIGINTAINAAGQGIGFAIPVNLVKKLLPELKEKGRISRSWLGVGIREVQPEMAEGFGLERAHGALIAQVVPEGPADKAGLQPGDIITRFDGKEVEAASELPLMAGLAGVGKTVRVELVRDGKTRKRTLTLGALPGEETEARTAKDTPGRDEPVGKLGLTVDDLDRRARAELELPRQIKGTLVTEVRSGSPAHEAGLRRGDVVMEVNGVSVPDARTFVKRVQGVPEGKLVRILLYREGSTLFTALLKP
jgi:serine protease Do